MLQFTFFMLLLLNILHFYMLLAQQCNYVHFVLYNGFLSQLIKICIYTAFFNQIITFTVALYFLICIESTVHGHLLSARITSFSISYKVGLVTRNSLSFVYLQMYFFFIFEYSLTGIWDSCGKFFFFSNLNMSSFFLLASTASICQ